MCHRQRGSGSKLKSSVPHKPVDTCGQRRTESQFLVLSQAPLCYACANAKGICLDYLPHDPKPKLESVFPDYVAYGCCGMTLLFVQHVMPLPLYIFVHPLYSGETGFRQVFPIFAAGERVSHTTKQPF